jgi:hypothetical protein
LINIGDAALAEELVTQAELETLIAELTHFTADARTIIACPRVFQVWGSGCPPRRRDGGGSACA